MLAGPLQANCKQLALELYLLKMFNKITSSLSLDNDPKHLSLPGSNICAAELPAPLHLVRLLDFVCVSSDAVRKLTWVCTLQGYGPGAVPHPHRERRRGSEANSGGHFGADRVGAKRRDGGSQPAAESAGHAVRPAGA